MVEASPWGDENGVLMRFVDWFCQFSVLDAFGIGDIMGWWLP